MVAAAFAIVAATVQAMSIAWEDRRSAKANTAVSDSVQRKRNFLVHIWRAIREMLKEFKYWLVEGSLHEPLKPSGNLDENVDAHSHAHKPHRTFRRVQIPIFRCDRCRKQARSLKYECTHCVQGYCTSCWPRTLKRGAHLDDTDEESFAPKYPSVQLHDLRSPHSATSSSNVSPMQAPTEDVPLRHIENGGFSL